MKTTVALKNPEKRASLRQSALAVRRRVQGTFADGDTGLRAFFVAHRSEAFFAMVGISIGHSYFGNQDTIREARTQFEENFDDIWASPESKDLVKFIGQSTTIDESKWQRLSRLTKRISTGLRRTSTLDDWLAEERLHFGIKTNLEELCLGFGIKLDDSDLEVKCATPVGSAGQPAINSEDIALRALIPNHLKRVIERTRYIETPGSQTRGRVGFRRELDEVFVQLTISERVRTISTNSRNPFSEQRNTQELIQIRERQIELAELLKAHRQITISGDPGAGKSTLLAFIARRCAQRIGNSSTGESLPALTPDDHQYIPVLLRLPLLANQITPQATVFDLARSALSDLPEIEIAYVLEAIRIGKAFLLLDGFDEMADSKRSLCNAAIRELMSSEVGRENYIIVAGRGSVINSLGLFTPANFDPIDPDPTQVQLRPMSQSQRRRFVELEFEAIGREPTPFLHILSERADLDEIAGNPLLLSIAIQLWLRQPDKGLPQYRAQLYYSLVGLVLDEWKAARDTVIGRESTTQDAIIRAMSHVAARMLGRKDNIATQSQLREDLIGLEPDAQRRSVLAVELVEHSGFFDVRGIDEEFHPTYGFLHQTYLELFAALYLVRFGESGEGLDGDTIVDRLRLVKFRSNWQVAVCLAFGYLASQKPDLCEYTCNAVFGTVVIQDGDPAREVPKNDCFKYWYDLERNLFGLMRVAAEGPVVAFTRRPDLWRAFLQWRWSVQNENPDKKEFEQLLSALARRDDWFGELCQSTEWVTSPERLTHSKNEDEDIGADRDDDIDHGGNALEFIADLSAHRPVEKALRQIEEWLSIAGPDSLHGDPFRSAAFSVVHKLKKRTEWTVERACEVFLLWTLESDLHRAYAAAMLLEGALEREDSSTLPVFGKRHQFHFEDRADLERAIQLVSAYKDGKRDFLMDLVDLAEWNVDREPYCLPFGNDAFSCLEKYASRPDLPANRIVGIVSRAIRLERPGITQGGGIHLLTLMAHRDDMKFEDGIGVIEGVLRRPFPYIDWDDQNADPNAQGPFAASITFLESLASRSDATFSRVAAMAELVAQLVSVPDDESDEDGDEIVCTWPLGESNTRYRILFAFARHPDCPSEVLEMIAREGLGDDCPIDELRFVNLLTFWASRDGDSCRSLIDNLYWGTQSEDDQKFATELLRLICSYETTDRAVALCLIQRASNPARSTLVVRLAMSVFERLAHAYQWSDRELLSIVLDSGRIGQEYLNGDSWYEGKRLWERLVPSVEITDADGLWDDFENFIEKDSGLDREPNWQFLNEVVNVLPPEGVRNYLRELRMAAPSLNELIYSQENVSDFRDDHAREFVDRIARTVSIGMVRPVLNEWLSSKENALRAGAWFMLSRIQMSTDLARYYIGLLFEEIESGQPYFHVHTREALKHLAQVVADGEPLTWVGGS